ncbi:MAG: hypothetical protein CVT95_00420 [Bacteroidetes bacterium HGW-Bacteroidetes-12]|jgi:hypothetical protein|nr:MAG: hypothetical protein CVT95_00420 [Bacteroidetes bacterium HGW-Bacteroidetes-12]
MKPIISYQFADSSLMKKKFETPVVPQDTTPIELLKEVDEININQFIKTKKKNQITEKHIIQENHSLDTVSSNEKYDTNDYVFRNESFSNLPIRQKLTVTNSIESPKTLFQPSIKPIGIQNWQIIILLGSLLLIALAKGLNQNRFRKIVRSIVSEQATFEIVRGEKIFLNQTNLFLNLVYLGTFSLYIYHFLYFQERVLTSSFEFFYYLQITSVLAIFFIAQLIFNAMLSFVFDMKEMQMEYVFNTSLFNNVLGVLFVPMLFLIYFTDLQNNVAFNNLILIVIFSILLFRTIRYIKIGTKKNISNLHIFLYICTLEILPLIVIIKFFIL